MICLNALYCWRITSKQFLVHDATILILFSDACHASRRYGHPEEHWTGRVRPSSRFQRLQLLNLIMIHKCPNETISLFLSCFPAPVAPAPTRAAATAPAPPTSGSLPAATASSWSPSSRPGRRWWPRARIISFLWTGGEKVVLQVVGNFKAYLWWNKTSSPNLEFFFLSISSNRLVVYGYNDTN